MIDLEKREAIIQAELMRLTRHKIVLKRLEIFLNIMIVLFLLINGYFLLRMWF